MSKAMASLQTGVVCDLCGTRLRNRDGLTSHKKHMHGHQKVLENHTKCQECSLDLFKVDRLRDHLTSVHEVPMEFETRAFLTLEDFHIWKISYERQNNCSYVIKKRCSKPGEFLYLFDCSRSGVYKNRKTTTKRLLKSQGTKKIGFSCTSTIKVTKLQGIFCVRFCKTHYGHATEVEHVNLSVVDRQEIADMLTQGLTIDEILEKYKASVDGDLKRIHLLKRKDIRNIAATNNIILKSKTKPKKVPKTSEEVKSVITEESEIIEFTNTHTTQVMENNLVLISEDGYNQTYCIIPNMAYEDNLSQ